MNAGKRLARRKPVSFPGLFLAKNVQPEKYDGDLQRDWNIASLNPIREAIPYSSS